MAEPVVDVHSTAAGQAAGIATAPRDILRIATAGSVDDGKSTLIGRLLFDSKAVFEDQYAAIERASRGDYVDLALLTDGLRAEREQGITIDVAYRYFSTPRRTFVLADTPGHVQYTRNTVTGASTADLAIVLVDARKGILEQSRRHAYLAALLRVPHMVVAVNKMDLVDWSQEVFEAVREEFRAFAVKLDVPDLTVVPISALRGDNVVTRSAAAPWYHGPALLEHLESVEVAGDRNLTDVRFPVQYVIRPQSDAFHDYRGYAGTVASGVLRPGDEVRVLPGGRTTTVAGIDGPRGPVDAAFPPMAVTVRLADDLDVSRGDLLCGPDGAPDGGPEVTQDLDALVCWMAEEPLRPRQRLAVKHTTRTVRTVVKEVVHRLDVNTLDREQEAGELGLNDIGRVRLRTMQPLFVDDYTRNRATGRFILVNEATNATVGAGMLVPQH
jgi:bifunctional enzyme CysN/CysC